MKLLMIEDNKSVSEMMQMFFQKEGWDVTFAYDGIEAMDKFNEDPDSWDMITLDLNLPKKDGMEVAKEIRAKSQTVPIIMLTAKGETFDKVMGLDLGADDYIVKPFDTKEVVARVKAVLRRTATEEEEGEVVYDKLVVNIDRYELRVDGKVIDTPPKELELLYHLAKNPNRVYTRDQLLDEVWGFDYYGDSRTVDVHIKRLREKLEGISDKWELKTVWGVGYKFETKK